jgi:uncharacterized membrane protein YozB (DUF420 family)
MVEFLHQPGFLGTAGNFATDATLVLMVLIGIAFTVGAATALLKKYEAHRWIQTSATALSTILVIWLMVLPYRDFVLPGVPDRLGERFYGLTTLHGVVGALAMPFGVFVVLRGNRLVPKALRFTNYKLFMRTAYALYMVTIALGIMVYFAWFVDNPNPPVFR